MSQNVTGTWSSGGRVTGASLGMDSTTNYGGGSSNNTSHRTSHRSSIAGTTSGSAMMSPSPQQQQYQNQYSSKKGIGAGTSNFGAGNKHKVPYPLFAPPEQTGGASGSSGSGDPNSNKTSRPYTVEAAGDQPLVGEWLAQRRYFLFPRIPPNRDMMWLWALLKSYVLRRDCMNESKKPSRFKKPPPPTNLEKQQERERIIQQEKKSQQQQQQQQQQMSGSVARGRRSQQQQQQMNSSINRKRMNASSSTKTTTTSITPSPYSQPKDISPIPQMKQEEEEEEEIEVFPEKQEESTAKTQQQQQQQQQQNEEGGETSMISTTATTTGIWSGTPSRNLNRTGGAFSPSPITSSTLSKSRRHHDDEQQEQLEQLEQEEEERKRAATSMSIINYSLQHNSKHSRFSPANNKHVAKLRDALVAVERKKMWYEKFDASRRAERAALSERRQQAVTMKNMIREWTWEEDEINQKRREEQVERDSENKRVAQERLAKQQRASTSLGIGGPVIIADFSYLKLKYFFQLLDSRPRNYKVAENEENLKLSSFEGTSTSTTATNENQNQNQNNTSMNTNTSMSSPPSASPQQNSNNDNNENNNNGNNDTDNNNNNNNKNKLFELSSSLTFSELLKSYRKYLVANDGSGGGGIDAWKEEDTSLMGGGGGGGGNNHSPSPSSSPGNAATAAAGSSSSSSSSPPHHGHGGSSPHSPTHGGTVSSHFPTNADKVSQRFYTRFLACDYTELEQIPLSLQSSAYSFDIDPPPCLPIIHGLKLKGNDFVDEHVIQCPNGNWRQPPGPVSSFHDFVFVMNMRCNLNINSNLNINNKSNNSIWKETLTTVDLSENKLTKLPLELLEIPLLHSLFLHANKFESLESLEPLSEKRGEQIMRFSLYGNPVIEKMEKPTAAPITIITDNNSSSNNNNNNSSSTNNSSSNNNKSLLRASHDIKKHLEFLHSQRGLATTSSTTGSMNNPAYKEYQNRILAMFPLLSHLDNVYLPCYDD